MHTKWTLVCYALLHDQYVRRLRLTEKKTTIYIKLMQIHLTHPRKLHTSSYHPLSKTFTFIYLLASNGKKVYLQVSSNASEIISLLYVYVYTPFILWQVPILI